MGGLVGQKGRVAGMRWLTCGAEHEVESAVSRCCHNEEEPCAMPGGTAVAVLRVPLPACAVCVSVPCVCVCVC